MTNRSFERAMALAAVTGLRAALGPALVASAYRRPERRALATAALGEMVLDKVPGMPSRSSLPLLLPRALAGAWVAKTVMEEEGDSSPWAMPMGAVVAAGVAVLAPKVRGLLKFVLPFPGPVLGLAEDYLALRIGGEATGLTMDDMKQIACESLDDVKAQIGPIVQSIGVG
ncbi:MAG: hypothetical protein ABI353_10545 [Isosphaeraceae bacterium]